MRSFVRIFCLLTLLNFCKSYLLCISHFDRQMQQTAEMDSTFCLPRDFLSSLFSSRHARQLFGQEGNKTMGERKRQRERERESEKACRVNLNQIFRHGASAEMKSISFVRHLKGFKWFSIVVTACCLLPVPGCLLSKRWQSSQASYVLTCPHMSFIIRFQC